MFICLCVQEHEHGLIAIRRTIYDSILSLPTCFGKENMQLTREDNLTRVNFASYNIQREAKSVCVTELIYIATSM